MPRIVEDQDDDQQGHFWDLPPITNAAATHSHPIANTINPALTPSVIVFISGTSDMPQTVKQFLTQSQARD